MTSHQSAHVQRLYDSISANVGKEAADEFAATFPLSKSADKERRFKWAEDVCIYLENHFDDNSACTIRQQCNCDYGITKAAEIRTMLKRTGTLEEFAERYNTLQRGGKIQIEGDSLLYIFPKCYCSCIKHVDKPISKIWCYCSLGFVHSMFGQALDSEVEVELMETIKSGSSRCVFRIRKKETL